MNIDYHHASNQHTLKGAVTALPLIFGERLPQSLLDVGCGTGTWIRAALKCGITDVCGIDGVELPGEQLLFPRDNFQRQDLTQSWRLPRRFEAALCLEVAEHIEETYSANLVSALVSHADRVVFSAACPGQTGQHHVNCQWPEYWQRLFNAHGYVCDDSIRWKIWEISTIEPWYRQNIFIAYRASEMAGREPRIAPVIHPQMIPLVAVELCAEAQNQKLKRIEQGSQPLAWYLHIPIKGLWKKFIRISQRS